MWKKAGTPNSRLLIRAKNGGGFHYYNADYWDSPVFSLDASVEKTFGKFSVYAKATNLLNTHYKRYIKTVNDYNAGFPLQDGDRTLIRDNYSGIGFWVGVRYKL